MDKNSGLKAPKKLACLLVKKCGNNGLELGNIKLITLYMCFCVMEFRSRVYYCIAFGFRYYIVMRRLGEKEADTPI